MLDKQRTSKIIKAALKEDIGTGDVTTTAIVNKVESVKAAIVAGEDSILCGIGVAEWVINTLDCSVRFKPQAEDGQEVHEGEEVAFLEGRARAILTAERTMLNFLSLLSGIATRVNRFVKIAERYGVKIYDTRKTFPLLRYLEKYAVEKGGGYNHRFGLWDQALIKENHLRLVKKDARQVLTKDIREKIGKNLKVEIEVENQEQFKTMLAQLPDIIMLDNMTADEVKKAATLRNKLTSKNKPLLEASGGINMDNVEEYAKTGVDRISIGALTDSVESIDMSLEILG